MATPRVSLTGTTFAKYPMSRSGRAPAARSKVGRIQRRSAPRPLPTDRTPTASSVSDGTGPTQIGASLPALWDAGGVGCRFPWRTHGESAEYRRTGENGKGGELTLADTRLGSGYQYLATRFRLRAALEARRPTRDHVARPVHAAEREADDIAPALGFGLTIPPTRQPGPEVCSIEAERVADVHKRIRPLRVIGREPFLHVLEQALAGSLPGIDVFLEGADRVLEHREHQPLLGLEGGIHRGLREVLGGKDGLRFELDRTATTKTDVSFHRRRCRRHAPLSEACANLIHATFWLWDMLQPPKGLKRP